MLLSGLLLLLAAATSSAEPNCDKSTVTCCFSASQSLIQIAVNGVRLTSQSTGEGSVVVFPELENSVLSFQGLGETGDLAVSCSSNRPSSSWNDLVSSGTWTSYGAIPAALVSGPSSLGACGEPGVLVRPGMYATDATSWELQVRITQDAWCLPDLAARRLDASLQGLSLTKSPTAKPTKRLTKTPTKRPTPGLTKAPTKRPTKSPTKRPTPGLTKTPTKRPTKVPTLAPTKRPTKAPTKRPTPGLTLAPTKRPTKAPTNRPTKRPTNAPTKRPTKTPTNSPALALTAQPTLRPTGQPVLLPTRLPTRLPTMLAPTFQPTLTPTGQPTLLPTRLPTTLTPTFQPTLTPTGQPTLLPTRLPTFQPTLTPTGQPAAQPTLNPTLPPKSPTFNIQIAFLGTASAPVQSAFQAAAARWSEVLGKSLPSYLRLPPGSYCGYNFSQGWTIIDLFIVARIAYIDGPLKILGSASPCIIDGRNLPRFGYMLFDEADVEMMVAGGTFGNVVLHEMGHVLGVGSLWEADLTLDGQPVPSKVGNSVLPGTGGYAYLGQYGNQGDLEVGRTGQAVVEDIGGEGTARGHWKESVYDSELMTGFSEGDGVAMPLSRLTLQSLRDLGFTDVDLSKADAYAAPAVSGRRLRSNRKNGVRLEGCTKRTHNITKIEALPKLGMEFFLAQERQRQERQQQDQLI
ncbi:hypothetical protein BASA81_008713 [Batrachochytrium salamandrivorans]|nr:hypothetical protein BASA81_008713 [Batrachochytrium salamandrivorans]